MIFQQIISITYIRYTGSVGQRICKAHLTKGGIFIFSWHHTLNYCVAWSCSQRQDVIENNQLIFNKSYFDESYFTMPVDGSEIILCNRKISTYVNALAKAGFDIEQMAEQTNQNTMESVEDDSDKTKKAKMLPISVCFKARKLYLLQGGIRAIPLINDKNERLHCH